MNKKIENIIESQVNYIAELLNIKTNSNFIVLDIINELSHIEDTADYIYFLRDNFNNLDVEFMTGFQKFLTLTKKYKLKKYCNDFAIEWIKILCEKVKAASSLVDEFSDVSFLNITYLEEGERVPLFKEYEIKALEEIGSFSMCVRLQRSSSGEDRLHNKILSNLKHQRTKLAAISNQKIERK